MRLGRFAAASMAHQRCGVRGRTFAFECWATLEVLLPKFPCCLWRTSSPLLDGAIRLLTESPRKLQHQLAWTSFWVSKFEFRVSFENNPTYLMRFIHVYRYCLAWGNVFCFVFLKRGFNVILVYGILENKRLFMICR